LETATIHDWYDEEIVTAATIGLHTCRIDSKQGQENDLEPFRTME